MPYTYTYLALGDSYTIGEGVAVYESFPYQTVQLLRKAGHSFRAPEILAKTGWTTDELSSGINKTILQSPYDFVTLLIGVNNQYRGRSVEDYAPQFEALLLQAISFAGNDASHTIALSIPDWGATPFAADRDRKKIAEEIDAYNKVNKELAIKHKAHYIDITPSTRNPNETLLAADKLHPSGKEYYRWAQEVAMTINLYTR
jgi:lysophospholipase L1-like esterase